MIGQEQYLAYKWTRFVKGVENIFNSIHKMNQLKLPKDAERLLITKGWQNIPQQPVVIIKCV